MIITSQTHLLYLCRELGQCLCTGVGSGGYAGDLTPPTIYAGDIDMYIPLEKPNT